MAGILRSIVSIGFLFRDFVLFGEFIASKLARLGTALLPSMEMEQYYRYCSIPEIHESHTFVDIITSNQATLYSRCSNFDSLYLSPSSSPLEGPKWEINRASYLDGAVNISARRAQFKLPQDGRAYNAS